MKLKGMNPALFASILLTGLRVVLGIFWLLQLTWKPPPTFGCPEGFCLWVGLEVQYPVIPLYGEFVKAVIQPNIILFGWMTTIVEVLIGLSLLFGLFTRLGALVGVGWTVPARQWGMVALFMAVALLTAWATGSEWREARECREAARELERGR